MPFRMTDDHFFYPHQLQPQEVVDLIVGTLHDARENVQIFLDPMIGLANFMQRICERYDVNPAVPLVAFQRERSLYSTAADRSSSSWRYACGVTGTDAPGMVNPRWAGLIPQVQLCVELNAWWLGRAPESIFAAPQATHEKRWAGEPITIDILNDMHEKSAEHACQTASEYAQLLFTPHLGLGGPHDTNTLDANGQYLQEWVHRFA